MFERAHHRAIAHILAALDGPFLKAHRCYFGGGTAIALRFGEYRESVDMDFLVSDLACYRELRQRLNGPDGIAAILQPERPIALPRDIRADQYGIRTRFAVGALPVKFEIVLEGRIELETPSDGDVICGISTLSRLDLAASKLLANSDGWGDDGVFNRDVIDLAMMRPGLPLLRRAIAKAESAYGHAVSTDLEKALRRLQDRTGWLERCMQAMVMTLPKALVWQRLRALGKALSRAAAG